MFSWLKFFSGFNIFSGEKLAKIIFYGILIAAGLGIYHRAFIMPTSNTSNRVVIENPREVHNHYEQILPKKGSFFGLSLGNIGLGVKYEK